MEATSAPRPHGVRIPRPRRLLAALSDERLVEHVRKGEGAAFEVLYDRYSAGLLGFCKHMLRSTVDAEDALQQTFIAAHADIQRAGERQLHVKAWLYTIARNRCLSTLRARREQVADEPIELVSESFTQDVQQRADLRTLLGDVAKLPDDQREALVLAELGDLSHEDIGAVIGCEASKVKSLVFQARTALIDRRTARDTPCEEIREQLATLKGGALRRSSIKHHLEACPGCTEYREEIKRQRAMLALALPVVPSAALKANVLGSLGLGGGTAAVAATTGAGAAAVGGAAGASTAGVGFAGAGLAKLGVTAALVVAGAGTAAVAQQGSLPLIQHKTPSAHTAPTPTNPSRSTTSSVVRATTGATPAKTSSGGQRSASGTAHGFTPTKGESNGARAREFAKTRGNGKHTGLTKTHTNRATTRPTVPTRSRKPVVPRANANPAPRTRVPSSTPKSTGPKATKPAPKGQAPTTPQSSAPQSVPETTVTPAPGNGGGGGGGNGQALGGSKRVTTEVAG